MLLAGGNCLGVRVVNREIRFNCLRDFLNGFQHTGVIACRDAQLLSWEDQNGILDGIQLIHGALNFRTAVGTT